MPMYEETWFVPAVLGGVVFFQLVLLVVILRVSGKVSALARQIASREPAAGPDRTQRKEENSDQKKWFNLFLEEDPARRELPKKEQFAAFRKWREEKGLNWKAPGEG